jgi:hypothetical protein
MRIALIALVALALGGCANSAAFQQPITDFATATTAAGTALGTYDSATTTIINAQRRAAALKPGSVVTFPPSTCAIGTPSCVVTVKIAGGGCPQDLCPVQIDHVIPNELQAMAEITAYAQGLNMIVAADDSANVKAGVDKAMSGIAGLATVVNPAAGAVITAYSAPVASTATFLFQQYQEQVKLDALRKATAAMDPLLYCATPADTCAARMFGTTADFMDAANTADLAQNFKQQWRNFDPSDPQAPAELDAWLAAANSLNTALTAKPSDLFNKMATAHHALTTALKSDDLSFGQTLDAIARLSAAADQIKTIAAQFKAAAKPAAAPSN